MKIETLRLENFRGIEDLPIRLQGDVNVFMGENGAGKTTVLHAASSLLSWLMNRIKTSGAPGTHIQPQDIKNNTSPSTIWVSVSDEDMMYKWNLVKVRKGRRRTGPTSSLEATAKLAGKIQERLEKYSEKTNIPLFVYYPVHRAVLDIPLRIRTRHDFSILEAYDYALTSGANFRTFFEWFREREDLENESRIGEQVEKTGLGSLMHCDKQLEAVRMALENFMPDFKNFRVRRKPLRMEVEKFGEVITVNQLSDGEKCLIALIGDLARRLAIANPMRNNPLEGEGVVLIDEIDLHLHPKWQRMMIPRLQETFPNCQFLISTHSPHVLTHVRPQNIFILHMDENGFSCTQPQESYGKTSERILEDLMGLETTRPDEISVELLRLSQEIHDGELDKAKAILEGLEGVLSADPDLVRARALIKRKELIGK